MRHLVQTFAIAAFAFLLVVAVAPAQEVCFEDPAGDDNGPGEYVYPTDAVYTKGSFDLTEFCLKAKGNKANAEISVNSNLKDPWRMGVGFSVQMVFIYIDNAEGGYTKGLPGTNHLFPEDQAWDKVIILSPQQIGRVNTEVEAKAADMKDGIVVPSRTKGAGRTISGSIKMADLGEGGAETPADEGAREAGLRRLAGPPGEQAQPDAEHQREGTEEQHGRCGERLHETPELGRIGTELRSDRKPSGAD